MQTPRGEKRQVKETKNHSSCMEFGSTYCHKGKFYFFARGYNGLFYIDMEAKTIHYVDSVEGYPMGGVYLFDTIGGIENKLILAPCCARHIIVYDMENGQQTRHLMQGGTGDLFATMYMHGEYAYLFGLHYPVILRFNPFTGEKCYYTDWYEAEKKQIDDNKKNGFFSKVSVCRRGDYLYAACRFANKILRISLSNAEWKYYTIENYEDSFNGLCYDGHYFWLCPYSKGELLRWECETNTYDIVELPNFQERGCRSYSGCIHWKQYIVVMPIGKNPLCIVRCDNLQVTEYATAEIFGLEEKPFPVSIWAETAEGNLWIHTCTGQNYMVVEKDGKIEFRPYDIYISESEVITLIEKMQKYFGHDSFWKESSITSLQFFLDYL